MKIIVVLIILFISGFIPRMAQTYLDSTATVHGHNNVKGAVIFPHNIGLGCTWNPDLVKEAARITALEMAGTGIDCLHRGAAG